MVFTFYFSCRALTRKVLSSSYLCEASSAGLMPYRGDNFPKVSIRDFPTSSLSLLGLPYRPGLPEEGGVVVRDTCMNVQCCQRGWQILCLYWTGGLPTVRVNWQTGCNWFALTWLAWDTNMISCTFGIKETTSKWRCLLLATYSAVRRHTRYPTNSRIDTLQLVAAVVLLKEAPCEYRTQGY